MATLKKVIKVTKEQYNILSSGGRVGDYVGLNDDYLYLIEDNTEYVDITTVSVPSTATLLDWNTTYTLAAIAGRHIRVTMPEAPVYSWDDIPDVPSTFPPAAHNHSTADITSGTFNIARIPDIPLAKITGVGTIGTTAASTLAITTTVQSASTDSQIPTAKAVWTIANTAGKVKEIQVGGVTQTISGTGVVNLPAYPVVPTLSISGRTITIGNNSTTWTDTVYSSGSGITIGTGNKINHSNSVTAQTTQALYPIKIDAQGHISAYGSAITSLPASDVYSWAKAANKPSYTLDEVTDGTSRKLSNYLPLSGGIMTGPLKWTNSTALPEQTSPQYFVCIDAFTDGGTTKWASLANVKTALGSMPASDVYSWAKAANKPTYSFSEIYDRYEHYLGWGAGGGKAGSFGPLDAALVSQLGANRVAGISGDAITLEKSNDGGSTWTTIPTSTVSVGERKALFTTSSDSFNIRYGSVNKVTDRMRITMNATDYSVYTQIYKIVMYVNTSGSTGCKVLVETAYYSSPTTWHTVGTYDISGWSGWNVINTGLPGSGCLGGSNYSQHNKFIRFTFSCAGVDSTYTSGLYVYKIYMYGGVGWNAPSILASEGVPYSYDYGLNVNFPANVNASSLSEGNVSLANKYATKSHSHTALPNRLALNPGSDSLANSYNEGIRVNQASNGWANAVFGGSTNTIQGTGSGVWLLGRRGAAGSTSGAAGDFTIEHNGSNGTGFTLYANGNAPTWNGTALSLSNHTHTQANLTSWLGLGTLNNSPAWGTVKSANGYTVRWGMDQTGGGGIVIGEKSGQTSLQVDGEIYVNEGASRLAKVSEIPTTMAWDSITGKPNTFTPSAHTHSYSDIADVSTVGTTAASTKTISTNSSSIASGNTDLVTGGAIYNYVQTEGGKIKEIRINGTTQTISSGVVNLPAYPSVSNNTITIKQTGLSDQTFTLNGSAKTITLADTNTWRPIGTGATDAAAGNHNHDSIYAKYTTTSALTPSTAIGNGFWYVSSNTASLSGADSNPLKQYHTGAADFRILTTAYSSEWLQQIATDFRSNNIYFRRKESNTWKDWVRIALSGEAQPASDVSAWAKATTKPAYTAAEVGALPNTTSFLKSISKSGNTYTVTNSADGTVTWTIPTVPTKTETSSSSISVVQGSYSNGVLTLTAVTAASTTHTHSLS